MTSSERWLEDFGVKYPEAPLLFVLPAAGSGVGGYRSWASSRSGVQIVAVRAPGRETRFGETPIREVGVFADLVAEAIDARADRVFGLFGHSLGALVAYEVARRLPDQPLLRKLIVAGASPPNLVGEDLSILEDAELVDALRQFDGTPRELLDRPEMMKLFLPSIRADFAVLASCRRSDPPGDVSLDIEGIAAGHDALAPSDRMRRWAGWTTGRFRLSVVSGGHFFPYDPLSRVRAIAASCLNSVVST